MSQIAYDSNSSVTVRVGLSTPLVEKGRETTKRRRGKNLSDWLKVTPLLKPSSSYILMRDVSSIEQLYLNGQYPIIIAVGNIW